MSGYASLESKKNELIRKGLQGSVFIAPITAAAVAVSTLFDAATGDLSALPTGYVDLGWTDQSGAAFDRKITSTDILGWGSNDPLRSDITADTSTMQVNAYEHNITSIGLYNTVDMTTLPALVNGVVTIPKPITSQARYYRVLVIAADQGTGGEIVVAKFLPRARVSDFGTQTYANGSDPIVSGMTLTAYQDSVLGYSSEQIFGGAGWLYLLHDMGISRVVTCTTATTTTLLATTGHFTAGDIGAVLSGTNITAATTIVSITDSTHAVMSAVGTGAGTAIAVTLT